ncbi:MAG: efflux RND transporter periplasmic adaptor subunit [Planctomycetota bacterium]|nr:MAG: efflux RND transporter periplasmic adaptor subunit [Planctomycetota bacterium]
MNPSLILFAAGVTLVNTLSGPFTAPAENTPARANTRTAVQILDTTGRDILPGTVRPRHEVVLGSPFDTLLAAVHVEEGQAVRKGDVVAIIDDRSAQAALRLAQAEASRTAQVERARAVLDQATDTVTRLERATASNATAASELTDAKSAEAIARADLLYAREQLHEAQLNLTLAEARFEEHVVRAPFDAVVVRIVAEPGAMLSPGEPIAELASLDQMCIDLYLPADLAAGLQPGSRYAIAMDDPIERTCTATVRYVEPRIDPISRTMRVVLDFESDRDPLVSGALARPATQFPEEPEQLVAFLQSLVDAAGTEQD